MMNRLKLQLIGLKGNSPCSFDACNVDPSSSLVTLFPDSWLKHGVSIPDYLVTDEETKHRMNNVTITPAEVVRTNTRFFRTSIQLSVQSVLIVSQFRMTPPVLALAQLYDRSQSDGVPDLCGPGLTEEDHIVVYGFVFCFSGCTKCEILLLSSSSRDYCITQSGLENVSKSRTDTASIYISLLFGYI